MTSDWERYGAYFFTNEQNLAQYITLKVTTGNRTPVENVMNLDFAIKWLGRLQFNCFGCDILLD